MKKILLTAILCIITNNLCMEQQVTPGQPYDENGWKAFFQDPNNPRKKELENMLSQALCPKTDTETPKEREYLLDDLFDFSFLSGRALSVRTSYIRIGDCGEIEKRLMHYWGGPQRICQLAEMILSEVGGNSKIRISEASCQYSVSSLTQLLHRYTYQEKRVQAFIQYLALDVAHKAKTKHDNGINPVISQLAERYKELYES